MQAVRFVGVGRPARIDDVPKPSPGPAGVYTVRPRGVNGHALGGSMNRVALTTTSTTRSVFWTCMPAALLPLATGGSIAAQSTPTSLPPLLNRYLTSGAKLDSGELKRLLAYEPVVKLLDADESKEVAVFGGETGALERQKAELRWTA